MSKILKIAGLTSLVAFGSTESSAVDSRMDGASSKIIKNHSNGTNLLQCKEMQLGRAILLQYMPTDKASLEIIKKQSNGINYLQLKDMYARKAILLQCMSTHRASLEIIKSRLNGFD